MKKVLLCDDDKTLIKVVEFIVQGLGVEVVSVTEGDLAMNAAKTSSPSLILLDLSLPGKDGMTVLKELKSDLATLNIPVVIVSAQECKESVNQAFKLGALDYIIKPFKPEELLALISKYLN
ncbi:PleD family two-component system response regulator [Elusimicrobiota bacterium]